jgi:hypothetical protein
LYCKAEKVAESHAQAIKANTTWPNLNACTAKDGVKHKVGGSMYYIAKNIIESCTAILEKFCLNPVICYFALVTKTDTKLLQIQVYCCKEIYSTNITLNSQEIFLYYVVKHSL